jgi:predicted glutamine amidotransferase
LFLQLNDEEIEEVEVDNEVEVQAVPNQEVQVIDLDYEATEEVLAHQSPPTAKVENEPQPGPSNETDENKTKTAKKRSGTIECLLSKLNYDLCIVRQLLRWKMRTTMISCVRSALTSGKALAPTESCPSSVVTCLAKAALRNGCARTKSVPSATSRIK